MSAHPRQRPTPHVHPLLPAGARLPGAV